MKRVYLLAFIMIIVITFLGCQASQQQVIAEETPIPTPAPTPTITVAPTPTPPSTPRAGSYTTGLPFEGEYKPVMAVIENSPAARPQLGLQTADVVYEVPVEGSITRFVCVFSDNVPEEIMPVRSGRVTFLYLQQEWDAILMHWGGSGSGVSGAPSYTFFGNELHEKIKIDVDGWSGKWNDYYKRVSSKKAPHNVKGNPLLVQQLYDYTPEPIKWLFNSNATYSGEDATQINLPMCTNDDEFVSYTYDSSQDVYLRYMSGKAFISAETDKQVSVKNVIVQYSTYESKDKYKVWNMIGKGHADMYIGGKLIKGTWEKKSVNEDTVFFDDKGEQIVLKPGNTWIHIHPEKK